MMDIKPTETDADCCARLKEVESLTMTESDAPEGEKLDVLIMLIEAYTAKNLPVDLPDPVEAIKFEMERKGLTVKDLGPQYPGILRIDPWTQRRSRSTISFRFSNAECG